MIDEDAFEFIFGNGNALNVKLPTLEECMDFFNSNKKDEEKSAYLLYVLILFDQSRKYPTAKETLKRFLKSNVGSGSKEELLKYLIENFYMNATFITEVGRILGTGHNSEIYPNNSSEFISSVLRELIV